MLATRAGDYTAPQRVTEAKLMDTILTVRNEDLERLGPPEAVDFFREALWAEASQLGIAKNLINVPSAITVADGGIDAEVRNAGVSGGQGIIKPGLTRYQIKTGNFSPKEAAKIRAILFKDKSKELKPRVKSCLDKHGTLVVVLFGWDGPDAQDQEVEGRFKDVLTKIDEKYSDADVEICRQNNLIGYLKPFPSLALKANRRGDLRFQTHESWSREAEMRRAFKAGRAQEEFIANLQSHLRQDAEPVHARVWGEPGIGKTRLALEATRPDDLRPVVIYCDAASKFRDSELMNQILREDNDFSAILVIDECDPEDRSYIWNKLMYHSPRIRVITIYNELDETGGKIAYFYAPTLEEQEIVKVIEDYAIPNDVARRWAHICSGLPRVAHVIGSNLRNNPEDLLKPPDTHNIWERHIVGGDDANSQHVQQRRLVMQHLALFKRFGYGKPFMREARAIAESVQKVDHQITWGTFQQIIRQLRQRRILQGETTLYITPKALHIWLWLDWWDTYGETFALDEFSKQLPDMLLSWFYEMFKYAAESETSAKKVREMLGAGGLLERENQLRTKLGSSFFLALAEADPESALAFLSRTVGRWSKAQLLGFTTGRREVVWALEMIAMRRELFGDAARLLLALGEAENESVSNSASGVFADLFSPAPGMVAPTEAPPQDRFPILEQALSSDSKERRLLALRACDKGLQSQHFTRDIGAEHQGLRPLPKLWTPKTYGEVFDAQRSVWQLLRGKVESLPEGERQEGANIFLRHLRGLGTIPALTEMVRSTIEELAKKPYVDKKTLLARIVELLHYDGKKMSPEVRHRWERLRDEITGSDFSSLLRRYAGMVLLEDTFDEDGNRVDQALPRIQELAQRAIDNRALLEPELGWLVSPAAENAYPFGYELGLRDMTFALLSTLIAAQKAVAKKQSLFFLGGYFRAVYDKNKARWEAELDALARDDETAHVVSELTWRSGMSDRAALRVLALAEAGVVGVEEFGMFRFGSVILDLSETVFGKWIKFLLASHELAAASVCLSLYYDYYLREEHPRRLPQQLTLQLLTHESLFKKIERGQRDHLADHLWARIGRAFVRHYPQRSLELADKILAHFGEEGTVLEGFHSETQSVLNDISRRFPEHVWRKITRYLGPPMDSRAFDIRQWLRGGQFFETGFQGALPFFPLTHIWQWVDEDVETRAWYVASFVPMLLFREEGRICYAREVLVRYGGRQDVRTELIANFSTEGWSGPASLHLKKKQQQLLDFKKQEPNENVKLWIDEFVSILQSDIEREKIEEERRGF